MYPLIRVRTKRPNAVRLNLRNTLRGWNLRFGFRQLKKQLGMCGDCHFWGVLVIYLQYPKAVLFFFSSGLHMGLSYLPEASQKVGDWQNILEPTSGPCVLRIVPGSVGLQGLETLSAMVWMQLYVSPSASWCNVQSLLGGSKLVEICSNCCLEGVPLEGV